jgi:acyl homoserine lactone synthase
MEVFMIHVVEPSAYENYENYLDEMYRQRTRLFSEKLEWEVSVDDKGREIDEFDHMSPVYLLAICPTTKRLKGSLRLLPTTGPTLLSQAFGATVPDGADVCSPLIWECTRLCVEEYSVENRSRLAGGLRTSFELLIALGEVGIRSGLTVFVVNF